MKTRLNLYKDEINQKLLDLCEKDTEIFLVGGYIRDILLQKTNDNEYFDKDYVIKGESAINFAKKAADLFGGYFVLLDEIHDIARVVMPDKKNTLDFAGCVGQNIYEDLQNRDYTINAIACKIEKNQSEIIDPLNGIEDLNKKAIRAISEKNIIDDPLRVLRAYRHAAQLGFSIEEKTLQLVETHKSLLNSVSAERITAELIKLLESDSAGKNLELMYKSGLLEEIFPELTAQKKIPPNLHHHLWLIEHSLETVKQLEKELVTFPQWAKEHICREFYSGTKALALLKLATLLHDIGKPATWSIDEAGKHRFIKHEEVGAEMSKSLLKRLKLSKNTIKYIAKIIKYHLYPSQLLNEGIEKVSEKAMMKMFRKITDEVPEVLLLAMADRLSARGPDISDEVVQKNIEGLRFFLENYKKTQEEVSKTPKLADGNEVIEILNIPKCPLVGRVLKDLYEAQISGEISTKEQAQQFIKSYKF